MSSVSDEVLAHLSPEFRSVEMFRCLPLNHQQNLQQLNTREVDLESVELPQLLSLLHTVNSFWNDGEIPAVLLSSIYRHRDLLLPEVDALGVQQELRELSKCWAKGDDLLWTAASTGRLEWLKYAHKYVKLSSVPAGEDYCAAAAMGGHLACLQYLHEQSYCWRAYCCTAAAKNGHLSCLRYAHEHGCPWDSSTCSTAAAACPLECKDVSCLIRVRLGTRVDAATNGQLSCLQYAHEHGCPWDEMTCSAAASSGQLDCLKYAHEQGCPWNESTCSEAAGHGHLDCLKYAHEQGCPWSGRTCLAAACFGTVECLQYAHVQGCPWGPWQRKVCDLAARRGNLACLKYARGHGCFFNAQKAFMAAVDGHLECLLYYVNKHGKGFYDKKTCFTVTALRHHGFLKPFGSDSPQTWSPAAAAAEARFETLREYAHTADCSLRSEACFAAAAAEGHLECLLYILDDLRREVGFDVNEL